MNKKNSILYKRNQEHMICFGKTAKHSKHIILKIWVIILIKVLSVLMASTQTSICFTAARCFWTLGTRYSNFVYVPSKKVSCWSIIAHNILVNSVLILRSVRYTSTSNIFCCCPNHLCIMAILNKPEHQNAN